MDSIWVIIQSGCQYPRLIILMFSSILKKRERGLERLFFEEGDVVLARCSQASPQPATIHSFRGYDVDEQEVYKVIFIGGAWAYLPRYFIHHLSYSNIRQLCEAMKNNHTFVKSLIKAESLIKSYGQTLGGKLYDRFNEIYNGNASFDMEFFGDEAIVRERGIESSMSFLNSNAQITDTQEPKEDSKTKRRRIRFSRCKIVPFFNLSISITQIDSVLNISIKMNNFTSKYTEKVPEVSTEQNVSYRKTKGNDSLLSLQKKTNMSALTLESESTSVEEGDSEQYMDNQLFKNIQKEMKEGFQKLQKYLTALKEKNNYGIDERFMDIEGINLSKLQTKIKEIFKILNGYYLTVHQIKLLFDNLNRFLYIFIEYHCPIFLAQNILKIKELIERTKERCLERVPVLKIFELTYHTFGRWLYMIQNEIKERKNQEKGNKFAPVELGNTERLRKNIVDVRQKYLAAISEVRQLLSM